MASETVDLILDFEAQRAVREMQQATDALREMEDAGDSVVSGARRAQSSLDDLGDEAQRTARSLREVEDGAGDTDSVLQGLAGALEVVNPELADAARTAGDLSGGFEAVVRAGSRIPAVFGVIGVAVAALAAVWQTLAENIKEAEERQKEFAERAARAQALSGQVVQERTIRQVGEQLAGGDISREAAIAQVAGVTGATGARGELQVLEIERITGQLRAAQERLAGLGQSAAELAERVDLQNAIEGLEQNLSAARGRFETIATEQATAVVDGLIEGVLAAEAALIDAGQTAGTAVARGAAEAPTGPVDPTGAVVTGAPQEVRVVEVPEITITNLRDEPITAQLPASFTQELGQGLGAAGQAAGFVAAGPGAALGALGPAGAALGGLAQLGAAGGAEGVTDQIEQFSDNIVAGLEAIPEVLVEIVPTLVDALVEDFIPALIEALPAAIIAGTVELPLQLAEVLFTLPGEVAEAIAEALGFGEETREAIRTGGRVGLGVATLGISELFREGQGVFGDLFSGIFQEGGRVDSTGLALVHRGEMIIPSSGAGSSTATRAAQQLGGGGINVDLRGALVGRDAGNEILRLLEETVGPGGLGSTSIDFNGAVGI